MLLDLPPQLIDLLESCCKDLRTNRDTNDRDLPEDCQCLPEDNRTHQLRRYDATEVPDIL